MQNVVELDLGPILQKQYQLVPDILCKSYISPALHQDAGVIGIPDDQAGEVARAFLVKAPGSTITDTFYPWKPGSW